MQLCSHHRITGSVNGRLFDSYSINGGFDFLTGSYSTSTGQSYKEGWNYLGTNAWPFAGWNYDWVLNDWMLVVDQWDLFRMNKYRHYPDGSGTWTSGVQLAFALGAGRYNQPTNFQCASVILYDRILPQAEILQVSWQACRLDHRDPKEHQLLIVHQVALCVHEHAEPGLGECCAAYA